ncbi:hypothetical protein QAD02_012935 [Eretmocerus hayati]|uniref:Uncharacterized protein n=1 Tax=Eretmocerus hayati TaxID=131215 RepID=A0ACC2P220_9HYME|nr:hypothetical protein QAD02_012935 [Eretmocerus hayati]
MLTTPDCWSDTMLQCKLNRWTSWTSQELYLEEAHLLLGRESMLRGRHRVVPTAKSALRYPQALSTAESGSILEATRRKVSHNTRKLSLKCATRYLQTLSTTESEASPAAECAPRHSQALSTAESMEESQQRSPAPPDVADAPEYSPLASEEDGTQQLNQYLQSN